MVANCDHRLAQGTLSRYLDCASGRRKSDRVAKDIADGQAQKVEIPMGTQPRKERQVKLFARGTRLELGVGNHLIDQFPKIDVFPTKSRFGTGQTGKTASPAAPLAAPAPPDAGSDCCPAASSPDSRPPI